jgi:predicted enzyme related to lactoylglutathione lyase
MIDCPDATMDNAVQFWSQALGLSVQRSADATSAYVGLSGNSGGLQVNLQRIGGNSRLHLDIETDDVEAEVQRLEKLGAQRHEHVNAWWVMVAPSGHYFCVVPAQSDDFLAQAHVWQTETSH